MLLPYRTSISPRRTPYVNYAIIIVNVLVYLLEYEVNNYTGATEFRAWVDHFTLSAQRPRLWQFVTYAFLHANLMHIFGNMYFLFIFGNNVNDKLGHIGYLSFYMAGAVFSGIGHILIGTGDVLGASGAIAAVTGAYLVLFPQTLISVFYFFFFIGTIELPALYFIAFKLIIWDNIFEPRLAPAAVAYSAHLSGYAFGIVSMVLLLATGLIKGSSYDLWAMIKQWNRRRRFRDAVSEDYDPFSPQTGVRRIKVKEIIKSAAEQQKDDQSSKLRNEISARIAEHNLPAAAENYLELMNHDPEQILPRQQLLDIANQLAGENKSAEAAGAYEQFLAHYPNYEYSEQVQLMLGIIYARYLDKPEPAIKHLQAAAKKLSDPGQLKMCQDELARLHE